MIESDTMLTDHSFSYTTARGRISTDDTGIWDDAHIPGIKRVIDFVHGHGGKIGIQLGHAGRKVGTCTSHLNCSIEQASM